MAMILPFRGILYNPDKVSGDEVTSPPYDIISPEFKDALYGKSPYNIVKIDFGKEMAGDNDSSNKYTRARDYLEQWKKDGILVRDDKPFFYAYEVDYTVSGVKKRLRGILAMVRIEELGSGIYPHEATHSKPKADRLNLMKSCFANVSPIYSLYNSPEKITSNILNNINETPYISSRDMDGFVHKVYKISDKSKIDLIMNELYDKPIFIADGHHRYEVALEFKKEMEGCGKKSRGDCAWEYVLMFLANMSDDGITILPTHRLVKGVSRENVLQKLERDFDISRLPFESDIIRTIAGGEKNTLGLYMDMEKHWYVLKYRGNDLVDIHASLRELDVVVLHELILKKDFGIADVAYDMDAEGAVSRVHNKDFDCVFFLNPTSVRDVERVALSNLRMPPKSTYFYPKLLTGMVINSFK